MFPFQQLPVHGRSLYAECMEQQLENKSYTTATDESPPIVITAHWSKDKTRTIQIVREDLLPGGTKQRAAIPFLKHFAERGVREFVYASPFCGFAQLALAQAAHHLGLKLVLFCEADPASDGNQAHALTKQAQDLGAYVALSRSLNEAERQAALYAFEVANVFKIPLGLHHEVFLHHYQSRIAEQLVILHQRLNGEPLRRLWLPVGSGTLARLFRKLLPVEVTLNCVDVRVLPSEDARIQGLTELPNVNLYRAEELFQEPSLGIAPVPSNIYYDAKLWTFIEAHAQTGDVWWNVAR